MCKKGDVTLEMKRRYKRNWYLSNKKRVAEHTRRYWAKRLKIDNKGEKTKKNKLDNMDVPINYQLYCSHQKMAPSAKKVQKSTS